MLRCTSRLICGMGIAMAISVSLLAAEPEAPAVEGTSSTSAPTDMIEQLGRPVALHVRPETVTLAHPRATQQIVVTGSYADGSLRDLTPYCDWQPANKELLKISSSGLLTGLADGQTQLVIRVASLDTRLPVTVQGSQRPVPVSFRHEVMPLLSSAGCSDIRCHGAPSGKNGFRLSLWGSDPDLDYMQLTREGNGRRTNAFAPHDSLVLLKALTHVSHAGGKRFEYNSTYANLLRDWQQDGLRDDPQASGVRSLEVFPAQRVLHAPARTQQLAVKATFENGQTADVTHRTAFASTDLAVANVDRTGKVAFHRQGEVAILCRFLGKMESVRLAHIAAPAAEYQWPEPPENNYVDKHVFAKLKLLHLTPGALCDDAQFIRRVYLDLCGILPTPLETRDFVASSSPEKRSQVIDRLLQRPEFTDFWTKKWMDVLRVSRDSIQLTGATAYQAWLRQQIADDRPLTEIVEALLTSRGESYTDPAANFYCVAPAPAEVTDPYYLQKDLAEATAQLFLGVRLQCAQCHNHPFERWTQDDYLGLAAFFTQVQRSRLGKAGPKGRPDRRQMAIAIDATLPEITRESREGTVPPGLLGQGAVANDADVDRRRVLATWLTGRDNPFFAKAVVNRLWFHLHGRGIVEPVDDFRDSNPSANDPLLEALATDFIAHDFKLRPLIRAIANSRTYQLASITDATDRNAARYFSHMLARPLPAEVLLDAICEVTGVPENFEVMQDYLEGIPTEAVRFPAGTRAVQLPVNDISTLINSSGKYVRYELHPFLRTFGQPNRTQTCECDREQKFSRRQALEMVVGPMVTDKLAHANNRIEQLLATQTADADMLQELYRRALCRDPSPATSAALLEYVATSADKRQAWEDVLWTILNSQEFIYQH